jgi:transposase
MPFAPAPALRLRRGDRERLEATVRKRTAPQRAVLRAKIVLHCAEGMPHRQIKRTLGTAIDTIVLWRKRYEAEGLDGLKDRPRPGRPPAFSPSATA